MKRLSSNKSKKILEFIIRKRLRVASAKILFVKCVRNLYCVDVEILHSDGKGKTSPLIVECLTDFGSSISQVEQIGSSFAKLLRWMEKQTQEGTIFEVDGIAIFTEHDSIESALVEIELED